MVFDAPVKLLHSVIHPSISCLKDAEELLLVDFREVWREPCLLTDNLFIHSTVGIQVTIFCQKHEHRIFTVRLFEIISGIS